MKAILFGFLVLILAAGVSLTIKKADAKSSKILNQNITRTLRQAKDIPECFSQAFLETTVHDYGSTMEKCRLLKLSLMLMNYCG
ncbi:hypothetical protein D3C81_1914120 [compost metagenome]